MTDKQIGIGDKDIFSVNEIASILSVDRSTVLGYIYTAKLKAHKMGNGTGKKGSRGRRWRIWRDDFISFLDKGSNIKEG